MKKLFKNVISLVLVIVFLVGSLNVYGMEGEKERLYLNDISKKVSEIAMENGETLRDFKIEDINIANAVLNARYDIIINRGINIYHDVYYYEMRKYINDKKGDFKDDSNKTIAQMIMHSTNSGRDATCIGGYNLIEKLSDFDTIKNEGIETVCTVLYALNLGNYERTDLKENSINYILNYDYKDINTLGKALIVLSNFSDIPEVKSFIDKNIEKMYTANKNNINEISIAATALCSNGIDCLKDERLSVNGVDVLDYIYNTYNTNKIIYDNETKSLVINCLLSYKSMKSNGNYTLNLKKDNNNLTTETINYINNNSEISKHWSKDSFLNLLKIGAVDYKMGDSINVDLPVTRGEFVYWLSNKMGCDKVATNDFNDVPLDYKYNKDIGGFIKKVVKDKYTPEQYIELNSVMDKCFGKNFRPDDYITREEAAFLIYCSEGLLNLNYADYDIDNSISSRILDYNECNDKYKDAVLYCIDKNIMTGRNGKMMPKSYMTLGEAFVVINK